MINFENQYLNNSIGENKNNKRQEKLDDRWYERFSEIAAFEDFKYLTGDRNFREQQKEKFLVGEIENPQLDYPEVKIEDLDEKENDLLELKNEIIEQEQSDIIKKIYRWKLNEKIAQIRMLKATGKGEDRKFFRYSKFIYGEPQKDIYEYTLSQVKKWVDTKLFNSESDIKSAAERLNKELFEALMNNDNEIKLENYNLPGLKEGSENEEYNSDEIKKAFEDYLNRYNIKGWNVIVDSKGKYSAINVGQEDREVRIPQNRKLKKIQLKALIEHEIGTHVKRRESGERSKLKILGLGLDRYVKGEEGVATYNEQKIKGASEFAGFAGHFAIALATGVDGKKRDFRQVFNVLRDFYLIKSKIKDKKEAQEKAERIAWNRCVRTFRGTTCSSKGYCFTKDIAYREGNIGVWNLLKDNSDEVRRFTIGKYDPGNPRHIWVLDQLGINDEDLEKIEENNT